MILKGHEQSIFIDKLLLLTESRLIFESNRVATQPGIPGEPGKVREFDIWPKNQGISAFYPKFWKGQEMWENFKA